MTFTPAQNDGISCVTELFRNRVIGRATAEVLLVGCGLSTDGARVALDFWAPRVIGYVVADTSVVNPIW